MPDTSPRPHDLLPLKEAAKLAFPHAPRLGESALRREHKKGRLAIYRIAGKDCTTLADIERMTELCRIQEKAPASTSSEQGEIATEGSSNVACGASEMDAAKSALDSARARVTALQQSQAQNSKTPSPPTSGPSGKSRAIATVIRLKS